MGSTEQYRETYPAPSTILFLWSCVALQIISEVILGVDIGIPLFDTLDATAAIQATSKGLDGVDSSSDDLSALSSHPHHQALRDEIIVKAFQQNYHATLTTRLFAVP